MKNPLEQLLGGIAGGICATLLLFAGTASMPGCAQDEGERCQITDDCASNLVCCKNTSIDKPKLDDIMNEGSCVAKNECQSDMVLE